MPDETNFLDAALQRAADAAGEPVAMLKLSILKSWLIAHGFLESRAANVAGAAAIIPTDLSERPVGSTHPGELFIPTGFRRGSRRSRT